MKVYILSEGMAYEGSTVCGVYATLAAGRTAAEAIVRERNEQLERFRKEEAEEGENYWSTEREPFQEKKENYWTDNGYDYISLREWDLQD